MALRICLIAISLILSIRSVLPQDGPGETEVCNIAKIVNECERLPDLTIQDLRILKYPELATGAIKTCTNDGQLFVSGGTDLEELAVDLVIIMALSQSCRVIRSSEDIEDNLQKALEKLLRAPHTFSFLNCAVLKRWLSEDNSGVAETLASQLGGLAPSSLAQVLKVIPGNLCDSDLAPLIGGILTSDAVTEALMSSPPTCGSKSNVGSRRCTWQDRATERLAGRGQGRRNRRPVGRGQRRGTTADPAGTGSEDEGGKSARPGSPGSSCQDVGREGPCAVAGPCRNLLCASIANTADVCNLHRIGCQVPKDRPLDPIQVCSVSSACLPTKKLRDAAKLIPLDLILSREQWDQYACCIPYLPRKDLKRIPSEVLCQLNTDACQLISKYWYVARAGNCSCDQLSHFAALLVPKCQDAEIMTAQTTDSEVAALVAVGNGRNPKLLRKIFKNTNGPLDNIVCNNPVVRILSGPDLDVADPQDIFKVFCHCPTPPDRTAALIIMYRMGDRLKRVLLDTCPEMLMVAIPEVVLGEITTPEDATILCNILRRIRPSERIPYKMEKLRKSLQDANIYAPACDFLTGRRDSNMNSTGSPPVATSTEDDVDKEDDNDDADDEVLSEEEREKRKKERDDGLLSRLYRRARRGRVELCDDEKKMLRQLGRGTTGRPSRRGRRQVEVTPCDMVGFYREFNVSLTDLITDKDLDSMEPDDLYQCASAFSLGLEEWDISSARIILRKIKEALGVGRASELQPVDVRVIGLACLALTPRELRELNNLDEFMYSLFGSSGRWSADQLKALAANWLSRSGKTPAQMTSDDVLVLQHLICGFTADQIRAIPTRALRGAARVLGELTTCQPEVLEAIVTHYKQPEAFGQVSTWGEAEFSEIGIVLAGLTKDELARLGPSVTEYLTPEVISQLSTEKFEGLTADQKMFLTSEQQEAAREDDSCQGSKCSNDRPKDSSTSSNSTIMLILFATLAARLSLLYY